MAACTTPPIVIIEGLEKLKKTGAVHLNEKSSVLCWFHFYCLLLLYYHCLDFSLLSMINYDAFQEESADFNSQHRFKSDLL